MLIVGFTPLPLSSFTALLLSTLHGRCVMADYEAITYIALAVSFFTLAWMSIAVYKNEYKDNSDWVIDYAAGKPYHKEIKGV